LIARRDVKWRVLAFAFSAEKSNIISEVFHSLTGAIKIRETTLTNHFHIKNEFFKLFTIPQRRWLMTTMNNAG
jgi:hypothetical protein